MILSSLCLWNENYLFVGCVDKTIKLIELNKGIIIKSLVGHDNVVVTVKKAVHNKYGEILISQNYQKSKIIIWAI